MKKILAWTVAILVPLNVFTLNINIPDISDINIEIPDIETTDLDTNDLEDFIEWLDTITNKNWVRKYQTPTTTKTIDWKN